MTKESIEQLHSEESLFVQHDTLWIQLPSHSIHRCLNNNNHGSKHGNTILIDNSMLETFSKVPFDIRMRDSVLIRSDWPRMDVENQYHPTFYLPETQLFPSNTMAVDATKLTNHRRMSTQSDALSAELIRRFSSESTTSSLSSLSSCTVDAIKSSTVPSSQQQYQKQYPSQNESNDAQTSSLVDTVNSLQVVATAEQMDRDPGHVCDTMQGALKKVKQRQTAITVEDEKLPVWADPIKAKANPTRLEYTKSYLRKKNMSPQSTSLPLAKACVFYFSDNSSILPHKSEHQYISTVRSIFECSTVWEFAARWRVYKTTYSKHPSELLPNQNIFCFIQGVEPMWEDDVNKDGGRLIFTVHSPSLLNDMFEWILCAFVGANLYDNGAVGIVLSKRSRGDRIEIWLDKTCHKEAIPALRMKLCDLLASTCHREIQTSRYKKHY